jgi:hypothetical protein
MELIERQKRFCINWEKKRKRKWRTILINALSWSVTFIVINSSANYFLFHKGIPSLKKLLISLLICGVGGLYMGWFFFRQSENRYWIIKSDLENE